MGPRRSGRGPGASGAELPERLDLGSHVAGQIRPPKENERYFALLRVEALRATTRQTRRLGSGEAEEQCDAQHGNASVLALISMGVLGNHQASS